MNEVRAPASQQSFAGHRFHKYVRPANFVIVSDIVSVDRRHRQRCIAFQELHRCHFALNGLVALARILGCFGGASALPNPSNPDNSVIKFQFENDVYPSPRTGSGSNDTSDSISKAVRLQLELGNVNPAEGLSCFRAFTEKSPKHIPSGTLARHE
jgi:hypothetical protein